MKKISKVVAFLLIVQMMICCKTQKEMAVQIQDKEVNYIPYFLKVYEADSLYIVKNYHRSYEILDSLFQEFEPINIESYNEILTFTRLKMILGKPLKEGEFSRLVSVYGFTGELFENDSIFKSFQLKEKKNLLDKQREFELRSEYINSLNMSLRFEIKQMKEKDQKFRKHKYRDNIKRQDSLDYSNQVRLKEIFEEIGFPNYRLIGNFMVDKSFVDVNAILLHTKDTVRVSYFMPKVLEFVKKGEALPFNYASMYDQYLLYNGKEQYYGSYENPINIPIGEVNRRRKLIGMPNYGYEAWRRSILYPN